MIRGELWWADFGLPFGSEPGFRRPALIVQDDAFNESKINTVIIIPLTTNVTLAEAPGNVFVEKEETGLTKDSVLVVSQLSAIDKRRLVELIGKVEKQTMVAVEDGMRFVLGMG